MSDDNNDPGKLVLSRLADVVANRMHTDGAEPGLAFEYLESLWDHAKSGTFKGIVPDIPVTEAFAPEVIEESLRAIRARLAVKGN